MREIACEMELEIREDRIFILVIRSLSPFNPAVGFSLWTLLLNQPRCFLMGRSGVTLVTQIGGMLRPSCSKGASAGESSRSSSATVTPQKVRAIQREESLGNCSEFL